MKKLQTLLAFVLLANGLLVLTQDEEFVEAPPIIWRETPVAVAPAPTKYTLRYFIGNSCEKLYEFQHIQADVASAVQVCNSVFTNQIVGRFRKFARGFMPGQQPAMVAPLPVVTPTTKQETVANNRIRSKRSVSNQTDHHPRSIGKRQWQLPMLFGAIVSNIWSTYMLSRSNGKTNAELHKELAATHTKISEINSSTNATLMELRATQELDNIQSKLLREHIHTTEQYVTGITVVAVVTADLISRMHLIGSYLDMVYNSIVAKRLDIGYLSLLLETNLLQDLDPANVEKDATMLVIHSDNSFTLEFVGNRHSLDTKVYAVKAFKHWGDVLGDEPKYYEYRGPGLVIYNKSSNCLKGMDEVIGNFVAAKCTETGYEDRRLWDWKTQAIGSPTSQPVQTQAISSWPWVYVYCFPGEIGLEGGKRVRCPPHPFQLDAMRRWSTTDYGEYHPNAIQIHNAANLNLTITKVHNSHFRNGTHFFTLTQAEDRVRKLRDQLASVSHAMGFKVHDQQVNYKWLFYITLATLGFCMIQRVYDLVKTLRNRVKIDQARATLERRRSAQALSQQLYEVVITNPSTRTNIGSSRLAIHGSADGHRP